MPLPGGERGLLTLPWSGLPAGQDSALTLISLSLTDSEMAREKERQHTCIKKKGWMMKKKQLQSSLLSQRGLLSGSRSEYSSLQQDIW